MRTIITPEFEAEVAKLWAATRRSVREYRVHPFAKSYHNGRCASAGCPLGLRQQRRVSGK